MKTVIAIYAAISFAPVAVAQSVSCDLLNELVASAPSGFQLHRGQPVVGLSKRFEAQLGIQSHTCTIEALNQGHLLGCHSKGGTSLVASMGQRKERDGIGTCLPDWAKGRVSSAVGIPGIEYGDSFTREPADGEISLTAFVARDDAVASLYNKRHGFSVVWKPAGKP